MPTNWLITMKPSFITECAALPGKETHQVMEKINLLTYDPHPDAKVKKQLKYLGGKLHRIRSGDYRIFYTFDERYVSLLALRRRSDETYDEDYDVEFLGGLDIELEGGGNTVTKAGAGQPDWEKIFSPPSSEKTKLPEPITAELLHNLHVPAECHTRLLRVETREELLSCPGVPDEILLRIDEYLFERPLVEVQRQPDFLLNDVSDLLRFKEGELLTFLLKLSPEQEKVVGWGMRSSGPTLVKGGPGTGKSTVALYRAQAIIEALQKQGAAAPRLLFTTYTNALVKSSRQLLSQLLGPKAKYVEVLTADSLIYSILNAAGEKPNYAANDVLREMLQKARAEALNRLEGNSLQKLAQEEALTRLSDSYLQEEILSVIVGRQLSSLDDYLKASRSGRKVALNSLQRKAVWKVSEALNELLNRSGLSTFSHARDLAQGLLESSLPLEPYDAVIVDEAQDMEPSVLRILVAVCKTPGGLYLTADANQSIYGSGFNWSDVHTTLKFQGRTAILKANYRSTREIGEAALSYLSGDQLDPEGQLREYINSGPLPVVRAVTAVKDEVHLLARFLPGAAREYRLGLGACAVFCPTENAGKLLCQRLNELNVKSTFMSGRDLDLSHPGVKVMTLKSSKGLEFPVVALAGFTESVYPNLPKDFPAEEKAEILGRERRTMFVAMTRAMRALLVVVPAAPKSPLPLLEGFNHELWNLR
ncbi:MAG TPA: UvrD-helicase domain-containing protein [Chloroflexia bacterium]|nr:UvrD-helicase domain-containing protein [Chloroflexia bacterium]